MRKLVIVAGLLLMSSGASTVAFAQTFTDFDCIKLERMSKGFFDSSFELYGNSAGVIVPSKEQKMEAESDVLLERATNYASLYNVFCKD